MKIFKEIKNYEIFPNYIKTNTFLNIFIRKYLIEKKDNGIPYIFQDLSFYNFKKFLVNFENLPLIEKNSNQIYNE